MKRKLLLLIITLSFCVNTISGCSRGDATGANNKEGGARTTEIEAEKAEKTNETLLGKSDFIKNAVPDTSRIDIFDTTVYEKMAEAYTIVLDAKEASNKTDKQVKGSPHDINDDNLPELIVTSYSETEEIIVEIYAFDGRDAILLAEIPCGDEGGADIDYYRRPILLCEAYDFDSLQYKVYEYDMSTNDVTVFKDGLTITPVTGGFSSERYDKPEPRINHISNLYIPSKPDEHEIMYDIRMELKWKGMFLEEPVSTKGLPVLSDVMMVDVEKSYVPEKLIEENQMPLELQIPVPTVTDGNKYYPAQDEAVFSIKASTREMSDSLSGKHNFDDKTGYTTPDGCIWITHGFLAAYNVEDLSEPCEERITIYNERTMTYLELTIQYDSGYLLGLEKPVLDDFESYREMLWDSVVAQADAAGSAENQSANIANVSSDNAEIPADSELDFAKVIEQYKLASNASFDEIMSSNDTLFPLATGYCSMVESSFGEQDVLTAPMLYTFYDINRDGTNEMLVVMNYGGDYLLIDIIALINGQPQSVKSSGVRWRLYLQEDGLIAEKQIAGAMTNYLYVYRLETGNALTEIYFCDTTHNANDGQIHYTRQSDGSINDTRAAELESLSWDAASLPASLNPETSGMWKNLR